MAEISKVTIPKALINEGGILRDFATTLMLVGHHSYKSGDNVEYRADLTKIQPTFAELAAVVTNGGYFENVKLGLEFANVAAAQQEVPAVVRNSISKDNTDPENPIETPKTFIQWLSEAGQTIKLVGGNYYLKAVYGGGLLNSDELAAIHAMTGIRVIEFATLAEKFADESGEVITL